MRYLLFLYLLNSISLFSLTIGTQISNVNVRDANDKPIKIPDLGKKVLVIFYTDPDVPDQNDEFADLLKTAKFPEQKYRGIGIANMKDTWKPNFAIRVVVRSKIEKYKSTILTDPSYILKNDWKLGDCNDKSVVLVLGQDRKVHFFKKGRLSKEEQQLALSTVTKLIKD